VIGNTVVTFRRTDPSGTVTSTAPVQVYIRPLRHDELIEAYGTEFQWRINYSSALSINGSVLAEEDEIVWSGLRAGSAPLHRPVIHLGPMGFASAVFVEKQ